jgi:glycosyltransferase involved in cell wall biosynthesis
MARAPDISAILPSVGVVVPTHDRPELVRRALASVLAQDYPGAIEVVVVFDRSEPDLALASSEPGRQVRVLANTRTPGLAGARNTGILHLTSELVAFCDDDDSWLPGKLGAQVERLRRRPESRFATCAMQVDYADGSTAIRRAGRSVVRFEDVAASRMSMLHSSSFVFVRDAMLGADGNAGFGLVDETMPRSMGEDWDLLLRVTRAAPIEHVDEPLVRVSWGGASYFSDVWVDKIAANAWLVEHHPELKANRRTWAMMLGKLAFGHAALGRRRAALGYAWQAARTSWHEPRTALALLVVAGVPAPVIVRQLNRRGHSI